MAEIPMIARLKGVFTALLTPMSEDARKIDLGAFEAHIERQMDAGIDGLIPCGTTGETPTLLASEMQELIRVASDGAQGKAPVFAGTANNDTWDTIELCQGAVRAGADGLMIVMPYYNKPSQEGLLRHVQLIHDAVDVPILIYNIPGRSSVMLSIDTTLRILDACPRVVGVKDATGGINYCQELIRRAGDRVAVLGGDDGLVLPMMSVGVRGVVSVTSNILPREVLRVVRAMELGDLPEARREHLRLLPVHQAMFQEPSPQPAKAAAALRGWMRAVPRPPMVQASSATVADLQRVFEEYLNR